VLLLLWDRDLEINPMTLKREGDLALLKLHTMTLLADGIQNLEPELKKNLNSLP